MIKRRSILLVIAVASLVGPGTGRAQAPAGKFKVCWVATGPSFDEPYNHAFVKRLAELGFVEGDNLTIERRHGDNMLERMPGIAGEIGNILGKKSA